MQAYLDHKNEGQRHGTIFTFMMLFFGIGAFFIAGQIVTGWLPFGERINIPRSNINPVEWGLILLSIIYGLACLRTAWGLNRREPASLSWIRWMSFITLFLGIVICASVVIPMALKFWQLLGRVDGTEIASAINDVLPSIYSVGSLLAFLSFLTLATIGIAVLLAFMIPSLSSLKKIPIIQWLFQPPRRLSYALIITFIIGIILIHFVGAFIVAEFPSAVDNIRHPEYERLILGFLLLISGLAAYAVARQGAEQSDELRRAVGLTPGKTIRLQLAKSPSAGAIIGFIAIFLGFTMATDLFLLPTSIASFITNVSTKGIIAIGVTFLMISGEFDLSVGSILGVTAMSFLLFMTEGIPIINVVLPPFAAALLALFVAFLLGSINGIILILTRIPSFIVTLGTLLAFRAITLVVIAGGRILRYRDHFDEFPQLFIPHEIFIILAIVGLLLLAYTAYRTIPVLWRRFISLWSIRNDNGHFGTTSAIAGGIVVGATTIILGILGLWLLLVAIFHLNPFQVRFDNATIVEIQETDSDGNLDTQQLLVLEGAQLSQQDTDVHVFLNDVELVREGNVLTIRNSENTNIRLDNAQVPVIQNADIVAETIPYSVDSLLRFDSRIFDEPRDLAVKLGQGVELVLVGGELVQPIVRSVVEDCIPSQETCDSSSSTVFDLALDRVVGVPEINVESNDNHVILTSTNTQILRLKLAEIVSTEEGPAIAFQNADLEFDNGTIILHTDRNTRVGFFEITNGRWQFTLEEVTQQTGWRFEIPTNSNFRLSIVWWLIFVIIFHILLTRTSFGNSVFAVGGNAGAARAQGINVDLVKMQNFVLVALLTGIAAIYEVARNPSVDPLTGEGWELEVIAMTVVGGALLSGGYGSIIGSLLGALIFGMLQTGLVLVGIESRLFQGTVGVIIIIAVVLNTAVRGRQGN